MSEQIPESIPTSADPRSKRPLKKRALSPRSQNAAQLDALFKKPDQEIQLPQSTSLTRPSGAQAPEIVANVQGSSAGAGSGEFHVYKASRRREYERLRAMDEEVKLEEEGEKWEREKAEREERDREKTRKNREKRDRLKAKKSGKGKAGQVGEGKGEGLKARVVTGHELNASEQLQGGAQEVEPVGLVIHDED